LDESALDLEGVLVLVLVVVVEESLAEVPERAMMVLLPKQVHLQKDVAAVLLQC
jgi:hypothetical protein